MSSGTAGRALVRVLHLFLNSLWHQLTEQVQEIYALPEAKKALPIIYSHFVTIWYKKMNPLVWVRLAMETARQLGSAQEALSLLEAVLEEVRKQQQSAGTGGTPLQQSTLLPALIVLATMEAAQYRLRLGDLAGAKAAIAACADTAEGYTAVDPIIPATFFRVSADYDKATMSFASYYRNCLLYLACVGGGSATEETMSVAEAQERAHDLCVAALLGDCIYNFGELLTHSILATLQGTPFAFLPDLLRAFNAGNLQSLTQHRDRISQHSTLASRLEFLRQKLCLMALVEAVFRQLKSGRVITFAVIAQATGVPLEQVEFLLMKALSLRLLRGIIQEPEATFEIEWVQPRVLDAAQLSDLRAGLVAWRGRVRGTFHLIHRLLPEALAAHATTS